MKLRSIELFSGGGGLALGLHESGFANVVLVEADKRAVATLARNAGGRWGATEARDAWEFDFRPYSGIDLVAGGSPCQPFSLSGKHKGHADARNLFPVLLRAVRETRPRAVLIENVRGFIRPKFLPYVRYVLAQLARPDAAPKDGEDWRSHARRLVKEVGPATYDVHGPWSIDCADFGVPQRRRRVFIVAFRSELGVDWIWPEATHSAEALAWAKWGDGSYWLARGLRPPERPAKVRVPEARPTTAPWLTLRDALAGLPEPEDGVESPGFPNHFGIPGARLYAGHTGSPLDEPAKAVKAGVHGVSGGENVVVFDDGAFRYLTPREAARVQTFPDDYVFDGSWGAVMRQVGNAVPVKVAEILGRAVAAALRDACPPGLDRLTKRLAAAPAFRGTLEEALARLPRV